MIGILHDKKFISPLLTAEYNHTKYKGKIELKKNKYYQCITFSIKNSNVAKALQSLVRLLSQCVVCLSVCNASVL